MVLICFCFPVADLVWRNAQFPGMKVSAAVLIEIGLLLIILPEGWHTYVLRWCRCVKQEEQSVPPPRSSDMPRPSRFEWRNTAYWIQDTIIMNTTKCLLKMKETSCIIYIIYYRYKKNFDFYKELSENQTKEKKYISDNGRNSCLIWKNSVYFHLSKEKLYFK